MNTICLLVFDRKIVSEFVSRIHYRIRLGVAVHRRFQLFFKVRTYFRECITTLFISRYILIIKLYQYWTFHKGVLTSAMSVMRMNPYELSSVSLITQNSYVMWWNFEYRTYLFMKSDGSNSSLHWALRQYFNSEWENPLASNPVVVFSFKVHKAIRSIHVYRVAFCFNTSVFMRDWSRTLKLLSRSFAWQVRWVCLFLNWVRDISVRFCPSNGPRLFVV